ncbi:hypothetical protein [Dyadobacter arcticus]|uniref:Extracellular endo-alpha-(1->5)-L-arabinanase C-terminal domain-containing protein n=1 Tax=Dyadobacter arcticus TaxID=1078754 RepID=A0ABX0URN2_9BACT|nr:hypothetical protein [Dyadobacter arcticus]NIJ54375.1 hypothetical protein [Dyadobacter arcticus]
MKRINYFMIAIVAICTLTAKASIETKAIDLIGTWKYTVSNVPPEYESGTITFQQKGDKIVGFVGEEMTELKDLKVDEQKITFKRDFEGRILIVNLVMDGEMLKGNIVADDEEYPITAVKEIKK